VLSVLACFAGTVALAACGGGSGEEAAVSASPATSACDVAGPSSLSAAHCAEQASPLSDIEPPAPAGRVDDAGCTGQPVVVVYAQLDWNRVAASMAKEGYRCAEYYISVAPVRDGTGLYTSPNPGQAERIHSFGDRFHAIADFNVAAWTEWLAQNPGKTWKDAGIEWGRRINAAGYDSAGGDVWGVNELPLEIFSDAGVLSDMRELIGGLSDGFGAKGLAYVVSPAQGSTDLESYRAGLRTLLEDDRFWQDMQRSVRFWAHEAYADPASCCVNGASTEEIATRMNEYFQVTLELADTVGASEAASFLGSAYVPMANAAWGWTEAYGDTAIPAADMNRFVAAEVFAMQSFQSQGREGAGIGFAWAPLQQGGTSTEQFLTASAGILDHIARSIGRSFEEDPSAACGDGGDGCRCEADGASFNDAWASFARSP
jgi:hypothetical protein